MCNYESPLEPDEHGRIWLYGDRYSREDENGHEFYIRVGTNYLFHGEGGPAKRLENSDGVEEEYWVHNIQHREDGPAVIKCEEEPFIFYRSMTKAERITEYMKHTDCCYYQWFWQDQELEFLEWLALTDLPDKDRAVLLLKYR